MFVKLMYNNDIFLRGAILLKLLEDRIVKDGIVKPGNVLKVCLLYTSDAADD